MPLLRFIPETTNVNFVKYRWVAFAIDGLLVVISVISILWHGFNLGIDFTGGVLMEVKAAQVVDIGKMRTEVDSLGFPESQLQYFGGGECDKPVNSCVMIRVQPKKNADPNDGGEAVVRAVKDKLGTGYQYRRTEVVGPKVSSELLNDGIIATILAVLMISVYVAVRFEWQYGVGALIATAHDVFVTAGFFSVLQLEFNIIHRGLAAAAGGLFDQRHGGGVRPHPREQAQVQAHVATRHDQSFHQPDRHPHHTGVGGDGAVGDPASVRRFGAAELCGRNPVRHRGGHLLVHLCRSDVVAKTEEATCLRSAGAAAARPKKLPLSYSGNQSLRSE